MDDKAVSRWDDVKAASLPGARVVIGLTHVDATGKAVRQEQMFGTVRKVEQGHGISIQLDGSRAGEVFSLPPDVAVFEPAAPGHYRMRQTGDVVINPDYTVAYDIHDKPD